MKEQRAPHDDALESLTDSELLHEVMPGEFLAATLARIAVIKVLLRGDCQTRRWSEVMSVRLAHIATGTLFTSSSSSASGLCQLKELAHLFNSVLTVRTILVAALTARLVDCRCRDFAEPRSGVVRPVPLHTRRVGLAASSRAACWSAFAAPSRWSHLCAGREPNLA